MADKTWIEQVVEKAVQEAVDGQVPQLRTELTRRVLAEVGPQLSGAAPPQNASVSLLKAISAIQTGTTQREILRALLDHSSQYCGRCALFVIKSGAASGWQGRGFSNHEEIKDFVLDASHGIAGRSMQSRISFAGSASEVDPRFVSHFGAPGDGHVLLLPLLLKERVAALVYADAGAEQGKLDHASLEVLVVSASAWLEVAASRKGSPKEAGSEPPAERAAQAAISAPPASSSSSSYSDPFASHPPSHLPAAVEPAAQAAVATASAFAEPEAAQAAATAAATAPDPFAALSPEDAELHRKAQRFARLLVDEIKLYNQAKVTEGRKNKDLYDRLKDDIDKSLASYQKRYGSTVAGSAGYFHQELLRSLAEDDSSVLGPNYQR